MLRSLTSKMPIRNMLLSGIPINTKKTEKMLSRSSMTSPKLMSASVTEEVEVTMTNYSSKNLTYRTPKKLLPTFSMRTEWSMRKKRSSSKVIILSPLNPTIRFSDFPEMPQWTISKRLIGNLPSNTILRTTPTMRRPIRNL